MVFQIDEREKQRGEKAREAIQLAMQCRWEEAVRVNEELLELTPQDIEASNRLGRAFLELGELERARHAFERTLVTAPDNAIAHKNLDRLASSESTGGQPQAIPTPLFSPAHFICDGGTSARMALHEVDAAHVGSFQVGATVHLCLRDGVLTVENNSGAYLGAVPPSIGGRLNRLIEGGNRYQAAVVAASTEGVTILVRETYRHPSQRSIISFPESAVLQPPLGVAIRHEPAQDDEHEQDVEEQPFVALEENDEFIDVAADDEPLFLSAADEDDESEQGDEGAPSEGEQGSEMSPTSSIEAADDLDDGPVIDDWDEDED